MRENGLNLEPDHPLFPARGFTTAGKPIPPKRFSEAGLKSKFIGHPPNRAGERAVVALIPDNAVAVGKTASQLIKNGIDATDEKVWRGCGAHGLRRLSDRIVSRYGNAWIAQRADPEFSSLQSAQIKEALLDHQTIPGDPYLYSGLGRPMGRQLLSLIGARLIEDALFGDLTLPRGPDERHLREALMAVHELRLCVRDTLREIDDSDFSLHNLAPDTSLSAAKVIRALALRDRLAHGEKDLERWEHRVVHLEDRANWIALSAGQQPIDLARLGREILAPQQDEPTRPPIRELLTGRELMHVYEVTAETVRRWANPGMSDRSRPWPPGKPPIISIDKKTNLYCSTFVISGGGLR